MAEDGEQPLPISEAEAQKEEAVAALLLFQPGGGGNDRPAARPLEGLQVRYPRSRTVRAARPPWRPQAGPQHAAVQHDHKQRRVYRGQHRAVVCLLAFQVRRAGIKKSYKKRAGPAVPVSTRHTHKKL
jgi:hypothetical protein